MAEDHQREAEIAWVSGLIDGEGCLRVQTCGTPEIAVDMVHRETIQKVQKILGGSVISYQRGECRKVWRWRAKSAEVAGILRECLPYFVTKRKEAVVLLQYLEGREHTSKGRGTQRTKQQLRVVEQVRAKLSRLKRDPRQPFEVSPVGNSLHPPVGGPAPKRRRK